MTATWALLSAGLLAPAAFASGPARAPAARAPREARLRGVVVDETGLVVPGATVSLMDGARVVATSPTAEDGSFSLPAAPGGDTIVASLAGFETVRVPRAAAARIVLPVAHATAVAEAVAEEDAPTVPTARAIGGALSRKAMIDLPTQGSARDALPLLPSVVRGTDGRLRFSGARPQESALLIDGFDIGDPATGLTQLDLAVEAVRGSSVLEDPPAVTLGGFLGGVAAVESRTGGDHTESGFEGFLPRPRLSGAGTFKRLDGFFPHVYTGGQAAGGRVHYFTSEEVDYEREPVPGVTRSSGVPDTGTTGVTALGRVDVTVTPRNNLTAEGVVFPQWTHRSGLSPLQGDAASPDLFNRDVLAGLTDRQVVGAASVLTLRAGVLAHRAEVHPTGSGDAETTPDGRQGNSFSTLARSASRATLGLAFERSIAAGKRRHDLTLFSALERRRLDGSVAETSFVVRDAAGRAVRSVEFGAPAALRARDHAEAVGLRDLFHASERVTLDAGARLDHDALGDAVPSARAGLEVALDARRVTVIKTTVGRFTGTLPLAAPAFAGFPLRVDRTLDAATGAVLAQSVLVPAALRLALPRATAASVRIERQMGPRVLVLAALSRRRASHLATLDVPPASSGGPLAVIADGTSLYRAAELAIQVSWGKGGKFFASYVRSSAHGSLDDFMMVFAGGDAPLVQAGADARLAADAPHRFVAWGTIDLPHGWVLAPATEWHSGFPWSVLDVRQLYAGAPGSRSFPAFFSLDCAIQKWVAFGRHRALVGVDLFDLTGHDNPRDVYAVLGSTQFGTFTNSVGRSLRGAYTLEW